MSRSCEKQFLFEARSRGYHVFRIPGIVVTKADTILVYCEARKGKGGDWDPIDICMRRSTDGGDTWSEPYVAMDHARYSKDNPVNNFVCIPDRQTGNVEALFSNNYERVYSTRSTDDGLSFSEPNDVTATFEFFRTEYRWRVIACGPGTVSSCRRAGWSFPSGCPTAAARSSAPGGPGIGRRWSPVSTPTITASRGSRAILFFATYRRFAIRTKRSR